MTDSTNAQRQARFHAVSDALRNCFSACELTDVHMAFGCVQKLLARQRRPDEDDADICDGVGAIVGLINETLVRREEALVDALQAMSVAFKQEQAQGTI